MFDEFKQPDCDNCKSTMKHVTLIEDSYKVFEYIYWCENCGTLLRINNNYKQEKTWYTPDSI